MKKIITAIFCLASISAFSQNVENDKNEDYKSIIKFSPLQFVFNTFQLGWEMMDGKSGSFVINGGVCYVDNESRYKEGYIGEFQYRMYVLRKETSAANTLHNLYLGPYINFKHFTIEQKYYYDPYYPPYGPYYDKETFNAYNFGVLAGINNVVAKRFHIDIFIGGGLRTSDSNMNDNDILEEGYKGIAPRVGIELGVNF